MSEEKTNYLESGSILNWFKVKERPENDSWVDMTSKSYEKWAEFQAKHMETD